MAINANKNSHIKTTNIKRLMSFVNEVDKNPSEYYEAKTSQDDITIWFIKIKNLSDEYSGGVYYMKIHFTEEYPFKAPDYYMLTPSGRFEINRKICFSNSGFHSESWSPLWGIHQIIMGMISFFYERDSYGIGHISNGSKKERSLFALESINYNKKNLANIDKMFPEIEIEIFPEKKTEDKTETVEEVKQLNENILLVPEEPTVKVKKTRTRKSIKKVEQFNDNILLVPEEPQTKKTKKRIDV